MSAQPAEVEVPATTRRPAARLAAALALSATHVTAGCVQGPPQEITRSTSNYCGAVLTDVGVQQGCAQRERIVKPTPQTLTGSETGDAVLAVGGVVLGAVLLGKVVGGGHGYGYRGW